MDSASHFSSIERRSAKYFCISVVTLQRLFILHEESRCWSLHGFRRWICKIKSSLLCWVCAHVWEWWLVINGKFKTNSTIEQHFNTWVLSSTGTFSCTDLCHLHSRSRDSSSWLFILWINIYFSSGFYWYSLGSESCWDKGILYFCLLSVGECAKIKLA